MTTVIVVGLLVIAFVVFAVIRIRCVSGGLSGQVHEVARIKREHRTAMTRIDQLTAIAIQRMAITALQSTSTPSRMSESKGLDRRTARPSDLGE